MNRPMILPHIRPLWRDPTTLQLGTDPDHAIVVEFTQPYAARVLGLVDGSRTIRGLIADAAALGVSAGEVEAVLTALDRTGVLVAAHTFTPPGRRPPFAGEAAALAARRLRDEPAGTRGRTPSQTLRRRAGARVLVAGRTRLSAPIAVALAAAGVGHVGTRVSGPVTTDDLAPGGLTAADLDRPADDAVRALVAGAAPGVTTATLRPAEAHLLVQVGNEPSAGGVTAYDRRRLPHLAVAVRDGAMVVGPFVPVAGSPCLACLDLHRGDRDPAWSALAAQLATAPPPAQLCAVATLLVGVGYAVADVLAHLDGDPPRSRAMTIELDGGGERTRRWTAHPRCDCRHGRRTWSGPGKN